MTRFDDLIHLVGNWTGHTSLWVDPTAPAAESGTTASISAVAGGKVLGIDYTWTHEDKAQDGRILLAVDADEGVQIAWCDSFHMGNKLMYLVEADTADHEVVTATGSWTVGDSEPWGWRIEVSPTSSGFQLRMYNILPASMGGTEMLAVQSDYTRV